MSEARAIRTIQARPIDAASFAPYGQLLDEPSNGTRDDYVGRLEAAPLEARGSNAAPSGLKANLAVIRAMPKPMPLRLEAMERHPYSSQAFMPLGAARYLVLVCPGRPDGAPDLDRLSAFTCRSDQAINYNRGTWHHGMTTLDAPGTFAMFMWDEGSERDTEWSRVAEPIQIVVE
jgi:ureidoglycolate lyase